MEKAGFWIRFAAHFLDNIILGILYFPIKLLSDYALAPIQQQGDLKMTFIALGLSILLNIICYSFYYCYFLSVKGATLGKMCCGLRVVDTNTGRNVTAGKAFVREIIGKFISGMLLTMGYLMVGFRSDKKALHDIMCHTQVVRVKQY